MSLRRTIKARRRSQSAEAQSARGKRPADERILDANLVPDRTILELREMITLIVGPVDLLRDFSANPSNSQDEGRLPLEF